MKDMYDAPRFMRRSEYVADQDGLGGHTHCEPQTSPHIPLR